MGTAIIKQTNTSSMGSKKVKYSKMICEKNKEVGEMVKGRKTVANYSGPYMTEYANQGTMYRIEGY